MQCKTTLERELDLDGQPAGYRPPNPKSLPSRTRVLKILHVVNNMGLGGTEKAVLKVVMGLKDGFEHRICCIRSFDRQWVQSYLEPEQVVALNVRPSRFSLSLRPLLRVIRSYKPDVVHSRNWGAIEAVLAARLAAVPVVIHSEHGYEIEFLSRTPLRQRWMRRLVCSVADAVFTVSHELRGFHASRAGVSPDRIGVVCNGVDTRSFAPNALTRLRMRSEICIAPADFVVGAVGRIVPIKDYATLIRAAAIVAETHPGLKLVLVGDGPELPRLRALAESLPALSGRFLFLGRRDDIPALLACLDVFVQTSLAEGMSNTVLEAMASGLPPIVTRVGGNPEIVTPGCGWLFNPSDAQHLSRLLLTLAADGPLGASTGQAARRRVEEHFSNEAMLGQYRRLYLQLACKRQLLDCEWEQAALQSTEASGT